MEKLNIAELLKDCPSGMELDCTMYEDVYFDHVNKQTIYCYIQREAYRTSISFNNRGTVTGDPKSKCVIFPKGKITWEKFHRPFKDGDIICNIEDTIIIYKKIDVKGYCGSFVSLDLNNTFIPHYLAYLEDACRFATEEEKQQLFDAIKANGYKWNDKTNTLEELTKFKVGDKIKHKGSELYCTLGEYSKGISAYRTNIGLSLTYKDLEQWELAPNKFDITTLKPFDKVLVRSSDVGCWMAHLFSFYDTNCITIDPYKCISQHNGGYAQCIPYEGNEHLLGTANDCDDYYKTWK